MHQGRRNALNGVRVAAHWFTSLWATGAWVIDDGHLRKGLPAADDAWVADAAAAARRPRGTVRSNHRGSIHDFQGHGCRARRDVELLHPVQLNAESIGRWIVASQVLSAARFAATAIESTIMTVSIVTAPGLAMVVKEKGLVSETLS